MLLLSSPVCCWSWIATLNGHSAAAESYFVVCAVFDLSLHAMVFIFLFFCPVITLQICACHSQLVQAAQINLLYYSFSK